MLAKSPTNHNKRLGFKGLSNAILSQWSSAVKIPSMLGERHRILIAEDFEENRIALTLMLKMVGFDAIEASDGEQAISMAQSAKPDLVLMDISLPLIDGLQATRRLRADAGLRQLPIIIVSGHDSPEIRDQVFAAGGTDYLSKPLDFDELKRKIDNYLGK